MYLFSLMCRSSLFKFNIFIIDTNLLLNIMKHLKHFGNLTFCFYINLKFYLLTYLFKSSLPFWLIKTETDNIIAKIETIICNAGKGNGSKTFIREKKLRFQMIQKKNKQQAEKNLILPKKIMINIAVLSLSVLLKSILDLNCLLIISSRTPSFINDSFVCVDTMWKLVILE